MFRRTQHWHAKQLILHIGAPRTGTSTIQLSLRQNRATLLKQGVLHPESLERVFVAAMTQAWPGDVQQRRIGVTGLTRSSSRPSNSLTGSTRVPSGNA